MFTNIHLYLDFHLVITIKKRISKYKYTEGEMFSNISSFFNGLLMKEVWHYNNGRALC